jgi:ethanolamine phosphate transferase 2 subunit G
VKPFLSIGQKFAGAPDIVKSILQPNPELLAILVCGTYALAGYSLYLNSFPRDDLFKRRVWPLVLVLICFVFKISMASEAGETLPIWLQHLPYAFYSWAPTLVAKARLSFLVNAIAIIWYSISWITDRSRRSWTVGLFGFINLFLLGQTRYANIPLFLLFEAQRWLLEISPCDEKWLLITCLCMQHVSFFALGNSNSLSSIDLSNAYNGISSYSVPLVGLLTFISNWAGPIWWIFAGLRFSEKRWYVEWMEWSSWFHGMGMLFLVGACVVLRTHLFIWTVFSPKFLFQAAWMVLAHIVVEGVIGGIVLSVG